MNGFIKILARPASWLYATGVWIRNMLYDQHLIITHDAPLPAICVGNLAVGGTGKTPMTEYLVRLLSPKYKVAVLSRGYKRETHGFLIADSKSTVRTIGDEPLQLHRKFPNIVVAVSADRVSGMKRLKQAYPDLQVVILDDAFQHRRIRCGMNILLTAADSLYVDDQFLPLGRLRDNKRQSLRADIVVVTKCPDNLKPIEKRIIETRLHLPSYQSLFFSHIQYPAIEHQGKALLLTAIARPEYLEAQMKKVYPSLEVLSYPDHHVFSRSEVQLIEKKAQFYDVVYTTEKDLTRLEALPLSDALRAKLMPVPITMRIDEQESFDKKIMQYMHENLKK